MIIQDMSPLNRFHLFVATTTITAMFWMLNRLPVWFPSANSLNIASKTALAYVGSAAFYQLLASALRWLINRWRLGRQLILGPSYVEGTWIGRFKDRNGQTRLTVEHFEQTLDGVVIRGYSYTPANGDDSVSSWKSTAVAIDTTLGILTFSYDCYRTAEKTKFEGLAQFSFLRDRPTDAPHGMSGYSADLTGDDQFPHGGNRFPNREQKISSKQLDLRDGWQKAKETFASY